MAFKLPDEVATQLWKLPVEASGWVGDEFLVRVIEAAYERYMAEKAG